MISVQRLYALGFKWDSGARRNKQKMHKAIVLLQNKKLGMSLNRLEQMLDFVVNDRKFI